MRSLLTVTALLEAATGLALALIPSFVGSLLTGSALTDPGSILMGRLAGTALLSIAIACWLSRKNTQSAVMVKAMVAYNVFSIILLVYSVLVEKVSGRGLWPAVVVHVGLLAWCFTSLLKRPKK